MKKLSNEILSQVSGGSTLKKAARITLGVASSVILIATTAAGAKFGYDVYCECESRSNTVGGQAKEILNDVLGKDFMETVNPHTPYQRLVYKTANFIMD